MIAAFIVTDRRRPYIAWQAAYDGSKVGSDRDNLLATFFLVRRELHFCALLRQLSHVAPVDFLVQLLLEPRVVGNLSFDATMRRCGFCFMEDARAAPRALLKIKVSV